MEKRNCLNRSLKMSNNLDDVKETIKAFKEVKLKLDEGIYQKMGEKGAILR